VLCAVFVPIYLGSSSLTNILVLQTAAAIDGSLRATSATQARLYERR